MRTDLEKTRYWILAASLACPKCYNRLWGNGEYAWCRSYDCDYVIAFDNVGELAHSYNKDNKYTIMMRGSIHQMGDGNYIIIGERVYGNKK